MAIWLLWALALTITFVIILIIIIAITVLTIVAVVVCAVASVLAILTDPIVVFSSTHVIAVEVNALDRFTIMETHTKGARTMFGQEPKIVPTVRKRYIDEVTFTGIRCGFGWQTQSFCRGDGLFVAPQGIWVSRIAFFTWIPQTYCLFAPLRVEDGLSCDVPTMENAPLLEPFPVKFDRQLLAVYREFKDVFVSRATANHSCSIWLEVSFFVVMLWLKQYDEMLFCLIKLEVF